MFVVLGRPSAQRPIDGHRLGGKACRPQRSRIRIGTHRTEGIRLSPRRPGPGSHLTATVGPSADPIAHATGLTKPTDQTATFHRQHDTVVVRARQPPGPHEISATPILEDAEVGPQDPAIGGRQFQSDRLATEQLEVDLNGNQGNLGRETGTHDA